MSASVPTRQVIQLSGFPISRTVAHLMSQPRFAFAKSHAPPSASSRRSVARPALAYGFPSRWLGGEGFFHPSGSADMPGTQEGACRTATSPFGYISPVGRVRPTSALLPHHRSHRYASSKAGAARRAPAQGGVDARRRQVGSAPSRLSDTTRMGQLQVGSLPSVLRTSHT